MNLHGVKTKLLINVLNSTEVGAYLNSITGEKNLVFKNIGLSIPFNANTTINTSTGIAAQRAAYILLVDKTAPCEDCEGLDYAVKLMSKYKTPGRNNSEIVPKLTPYGNLIPGADLTVSGGFISAANCVTIMADMVDQISSHTGDDGAPAYASQAYCWTSAGGGNIVLAASALSISLAGNGANAAARIDNLIANAAATDYIRIFRDPTVSTTIWAMFIGPRNGQTSVTWTTETNITPVSTSADATYIGLYQNDDEKALYVSFDPITQFTKYELQAPRYATLTPNDVFEEFMFTPNEGSLSQLRRGTVPLDEAYTKYSFQWQSTVPSLSEGAGHFNNMKSNFDLYIPTSQLTTNKWDATDLMYQTGDSAFTADSTWAQLLAWWQNSAAKGVITTVPTTATITVTTKTATNGNYIVVVDGRLFEVPVLAAEADVTATAVKIKNILDADTLLASSNALGVVSLSYADGVTSIGSVTQAANGTGIVATIALV